MIIITKIRRKMQLQKERALFTPENEAAMRRIMVEEILSHQTKK